MQEGLWVLFPQLEGPPTHPPRSDHFLCHISPRWLQRTPKHPHTCSHAQAHSLKAQTILTNTLHPHLQLHTHWGKQNQPHSPGNPYVLSPLTAPPQPGFPLLSRGQWNLVGMRRECRLQFCLHPRHHIRDRMPGFWVPTADLSVIHSRTSIFPSEKWEQSLGLPPPHSQMERYQKDSGITGFNKMKFQDFPGSPRLRLHATMQEAWV